MKLKKPAQVGNTIFGKGVSERLVIDRAQREYVYRQKPEVDARRVKKFRAFVAQMRKAARKGLKIRRVDREVAK